MRPSPILRRAPRFQADPHAPLAGLFFVIDGALEVSIPAQVDASRSGKKRKPTPTPATSNGGPTSRRAPPSTRDGTPTAASRSSEPRPTHLYTVKPGGVAGYLSALSNAPSYVDLKAKTDVYVGFLPAEALERLLEKRPIVLLTLAKRLISLLSPLGASFLAPSRAPPRRSDRLTRSPRPRAVLHIDASLEWMQLDAGQVLYRQGDESDSIYIVVNGRLRALQDAEGSSQVETVAEHGQGESVGCVLRLSHPRPLRVYPLTLCSPAQRARCHHQASPEQHRARRPRHRARAHAAHALQRHLCPVRPRSAALLAHHKQR